MLVDVCFAVGFKDKRFVVLFVAVIVASLKVDLNLFVGNFGGGVLCLSRCDAIGIIVALVKLWFDSVPLAVKRGGVIFVDKCLDRVFLPPGSLWRIVAACGVGENWIVHS